MSSTIIITGTPGTLKSELAKALEKEGYKHVDVHDFIVDASIVECYDDVNDCDVVDRDTFAAAIQEYIKKSGEDLVFDSHIAHYAPPEVVTLCVVAHSDIEVITERLKKRNYSEKKIRDNVQGEIFHLCEEEAAVHDCLIIDTTKGVPTTFVEQVKDRMSQKAHLR